jgi:cyclase
MRQLSKHLFAETEFQWANVGAAVTEEGVVLIDCPVRPTDSKRWQEELRSLNPLGIRYLIATDFHGDHCTGSAFVKGATFIAPQLVYEKISGAKGRDTSFKGMFVETLREKGYVEEANEITDAVLPLPKICFEETLTLHFPPLTFEIRRMGGHTPACSVVYVPEERVIFTGDVVMDSRCPGMGEANLSQWVKALDWVECLPVDHIVPGHGGVCGKEVVRKLKEYLTEVRETMEKLVRAGRTKVEAVEDGSLEKFFWVDPARGAYWAQSRKETFRRALGSIYDEVKGTLTSS